MDKHSPDTHHMNSPTDEYPSGRSSQGVRHDPAPGMPPYAVHDHPRRLRESSIPKAFLSLREQHWGSRPKSYIARLAQDAGESVPRVILETDDSEDGLGASEPERPGTPGTTGVRRHNVALQPPYDPDPCPQSQQQPRSPTTNSDSDDLASLTGQSGDAWDIRIHAQMQHNAQLESANQRHRQRIEEYELELEVLRLLQGAPPEMHWQSESEWCSDDLYDISEAW